MIVDLVIVVGGLIFIALILLSAWCEPTEAPTLSQWEAEREIRRIKRQAITRLYGLEQHGRTTVYDDDVIDGTAREVVE